MNLANRILGGILGDTTPVTTEREAVDYLFSRDPSVIMVNGFVLRVAPQKHFRLLVNDPRLEQRYERKYVLEDWALVWEKKGLSTRPPILPNGIRMIPLTNQHLGF